MALRLYAIPLINLRSVSAGHQQSLHIHNRHRVVHSADHHRHVVPLFLRCDIDRSQIASRTESSLEKRFNAAATWVMLKWDGLGDLKEGTLGKRLHSFGTGILDRIPAEEYFLREIGWDVPQRIRARLHHPAELSETTVVNYLTALANRRLPYHYKWTVLSVLCLPFSAAMTILPGPNVFLLYNAVRLRDHFCAWRGSQNLARVLKEGGLINEGVSSTIEDLLAKDEGGESLKDGRVRSGTL
ncbi:hypothetical protein HK101_007172 [Irineochytrium annulatum]|nr:hypothetical protein HK101_007172 [Irineochytrium annulatum]